MPEDEMTEEEIIQQKAVEQIIAREYRRAHDPTWPVAAAKAVIEYLKAANHVP